MRDTIFDRRLDRRHVIQGLAAVPALTFAAGSSRADTLDEIKKRGYMTVATEDDFQPFEFTKDGKPTGYDTELLQMMEKTLSFKVKQDIIPWTGILAGVSTGKYDAAVTAALVTAERLNTFDFASPVAESQNYYMIRAKDSRIKSIKDLSGLNLGVEAGSAMLKQLPQLEEMLKATGGKLGKIVQYQGYPEAYQDLASSRLDYVVNTFLSIESVVHSKPGVFATGEPVSKPSYIAWAIAKGNTSVAGLFDDFLAKARADGSMYALQKKWFYGKSFEHMPVKATVAS